jgi:hypothetical protein
MDLASSPICVEKNSAGPGVAGDANKPDRCAVKHEIVALILIGIRGTEQKRLSGVIDSMIRGLLLGKGRAERVDGAPTPSFCMNIKRKELQSLHFVSR